MAAAYTLAQPVSHDFYSACAGKQQFPSMAVARVAMTRKQRAGGFRRGDRNPASRKPGRIEVYRCRFCDSFHMGHDRTRQPKNEVDRAW
jgi:hypothetical protein